MRTVGAVEFTEEVFDTLQFWVWSFLVKFLAFLLFIALEDLTKDLPLEVQACKLFSVSERKHFLQLLHEYRCPTDCSSFSGTL